MSAAEITLDFQRHERLGLGEAIFCVGKNIDQINVILDQAQERNASLLLTRLDANRVHEIAERHRRRIDYDAVSRTAFFGTPAAAKPERHVAIVTAGTSDVPVAREAARTLRFNGEATTEFNDIGVAGLWRLQARLEELQRFPVLIVAAGMDAALVSVLGGMFRGALIAAPTSVGYGVAQGGHAALNATLASCAPGVMVVNIDNGYGAACAALRITQLLRGR